MTVVCKYNQRGYCKFKNKCRLFHNNEECPSENCEDELCDRRHPNACKFYESYGNCKFGSYCRYKHSVQNKSNEIDEMGNKVNGLVDDLKKKGNEIDVLGNTVIGMVNDSKKKEDEICFLKDYISKLENQIQDLTKKLNEINEEVKEIGCQHHLRKCDMCEKTFKTKQSFQNHMKSHQTIPQLDGDNDEMESESENCEEKILNEVIFTPDCQADWSDKVVHDLIIKKVNEAGLKPLSMTIVRNKKGNFTSCESKIEPVPSRRCKEISFTFNGIWTWKFG